ncbi:MAG: WecB/TagA/CpsF family glycosyltransferase [Paracoccaceae bacterium]
MLALDFRFDGSVVTVNLPNRQALFHAVTARFASKQGFAVATINLDHLVKLARSAAFRRAYCAQDMVVADGNPIVWLSRLAGHPVSLVHGSDLVVPLAQLAAQSGVRVGLVGSTDTALALAADRLRALVPGLDVALCIAPPFGFDPEGAGAEGILTELSVANIGLCLIALGAPKQEIFAARGRVLTPQIGFASVGAGLDFLAGHQTRAPKWVRKLAMEWVWRMLSDPRRLIPRYAACLAILPGQAIAAVRQRRE